MRSTRVRACGAAWLWARRRTLLLGLVGLGVLGMAGLVRGQLARRGGEFQINTVTEGDQRSARIAALPDGGFVVVWQSNGVAGRRFDSNTQALGAEFKVNSSPVGFAPDPSIGVAPNGSFLVAWCAAGINAQAFDPGGKRRGSEFVVAAQSYVGSGIAPAGGDELAVAWTDTSYHGEARLKSDRGQGAPFRVNEEGYQYNLAAAGTGDGSYRVVWYDGGGLIRGRSFTGSQPSGDAFDIGAVSSGFHQGPSICSQQDGGFVVSWSTYGPKGSVPVTYRVYNPSDTPVTPPLPVTAEQDGLVSQVRPMVACGPDTQFVGSWVESIAGSTAIRGRAFGSNGPLLGSDFTIGLRDGEDGDGGAITRLAGGDLLVTWTDCDAPATCDIFGQRFTTSGMVDCAGDCNRDGRVSIDELIKAVTIALDSDNPSLMKQCLPADVNLDYRVTIDELVRAVDRALDGCS